MEKDSKLEKLLYESWPDIKERKNLMELLTHSTTYSVIFIKLSEYKKISNENCPHLNAMLSNSHSAMDFAKQLNKDGDEFYNRLNSINADSDNSLDELLNSKFYIASNIAKNDFYDGTLETMEKIKRCCNPDELPRLEQYAKEMSNQNTFDNLRSILNQKQTIQK